MNAELAWMVAIFWIDRKPVRGVEAHRTELISRMDLKVGWEMGGRELNEVGSIRSGRALEGAIIYGMGNMGSKR